jgi:hypothetical protein
MFSYSFGATPETTAIGAMYADPKKPPVVRRVNVVSEYATVLTSGGRIEGRLNNDPILLKRFSFGWQPLDVLNDVCVLKAQRLPSRVEDHLMIGMPRLNKDRACGATRRDTGPTVEVEAVRRLMRGPFVPYVSVSGSWAMGEWYGGGGGESLYQKHNGRWRLVESGGGAMGVSDMRKYGVPESDWCEFHIVDAKCPSWFDYAPSGRYAHHDSALRTLRSEW